jgi:hypothetical protein
MNLYEMLMGFMVVFIIWMHTFTKGYEEEDDEEEEDFRQNHQ